MKILYIGHYREGTGWSQAAIDYILALDKAGVEVVCRPVKLNNAIPELPQRILELEAKSSEGCDVCIQHVLPHYMDYNSNFFNVGVAIVETDSIKYTSWATRLENMDAVFTPSIHGRNTCKNSGITKPTYVVPHACDITKYKEYEPFNLPVQDEYIFYFIGEHIRRKHLSALLQAYHVEFDSNDNVALVIKTHKSGLSPDQAFDRVKQTSDMIKHNIRKYVKFDRYNSEHIITDYLTVDQIMSLHQRCDCFVNTSFGEAWSIPTFDAMAMRNQVISSNTGGMSNYLNEEDLVDGRLEPVVGADMIFEDLHTCNENWFNINPLDLQWHMRNKYENRDNLAAYTYPHIEKYSYKKIGELMKGIIDESIGNASC